MDRTDPASDAERMFLTIFGPDLEADGVESGLYLPLKDEEGVLGVLVFEAAKPEFATPVQLEVAAILANQTAVALRNAQLYHQVPMVDALGALAAKKRALLAVPRRKLQLYGGIALALLAAAVLIRWPLRVVGTEATFRPMASSPGAGTGSWSRGANPGEGRRSRRARCSVGITPLHQPGKRSGGHGRSDRGRGAAGGGSSEPGQPG